MTAHVPPASSSDSWPEDYRHIGSTYSRQLRHIYVEVALSHLLPHLVETRAVRVLDWELFSYLPALALAKRGFFVELVIEDAHARNAALHAVESTGYKDWVRVSESMPITYLDTPSPHYHLVLCHLVYSPAVHLRELLRPNGVVSVVKANLHNLPLHQAHLDLAPYDILNSLSKAQHDTPTPVIQWLEKDGVEIIAQYGIGVFSDYLEGLAGSASEGAVAQIQELEMVASSSPQYLETAAYSQYVGLMH